MPQLTAVIVEDEDLGLKNLQDKIKRNCPQVNLVGICKTSLEAIRNIPIWKPELVFLDINLDNLNGFDVLDRLRYISFEIIFTTDYDQFVIDAIRANATDFLIKPINENDLVNAVHRVWEKTKQVPQTFSRITIPTTHGFKFVNIEEIIHCEADDNRTIFHLYNKQTLRTPRNLGHIEQQLQDFNFLRIHRSHLINKDYMEEFSRRDGGFVIMTNGDRLTVAKNKFSLFKSP